MNNFWLNRKWERAQLPLPWLPTTYLKYESLKYELKRLEDLLLPRINESIADPLLTNRPDLSREEMRDIIKNVVSQTLALEYQRRIEYYSFVGVGLNALIGYFIKYFNTGW